MKPEGALETFQQYLAQAGLELKSLTPASSISAALSFYREERADGCSFEDDADMLLFQWGTYDWGTYDWGNGEFFDLDITRQLIIDGVAEDDNIWQLSLTFKFTPTNALRDLGSSSRWCANVDQVEEFEEYIRESPAFQAVAQRQADTVDLQYFCAG